MTILGIDFDNTIVTYDELFYELALEKGLIEGKIEKKKSAVRDNMRERGLDRDFTQLQGEVYGLRIKEAKQAEGMMKALMELKSKNIKMIIISHKTLRPIGGQNYNLHEAAMDWLADNKFFSQSGLNWKLENIYFETTKEKKVERIKQQECTHFIDDLPEILNIIDKDVNRILYEPSNREHKTYNKDLQVMSSWNMIAELILDK